jgi:integrase
MSRSKGIFCCLSFIEHLIDTPTCGYVLALSCTQTVPTDVPCGRPVSTAVGSMAVASIEKRVGKTGTKYAVRYRVNGKNARATFDTWREAQDFKVEIEGKVQRGKAIDPKRGKQTYEQWHAAWMQGRVNVRPATRQRSMQIARAHLLPTFGSTPVDQITQPQVQAWVASMDVAPATVRKAYVELNASLNAAVAAGVIYDNPCKSINLPKQTKAKMTVLDHEQIRQLVACTQKRYQALVLFLAYSGLRIGEACDLKPENVDLDRGYVHVVSTLTVDDAGRRVSGAPKSSAGVRTVPIPQAVREALRAHMEAYPADYVFTGGHGKQLHPHNFSQRTFKAAVEKWNQQNGTSIPVRVHDLRHTAVTHWIRAKVDLPRIVAWAGHESASFTLDRYAHYFPKDDTQHMDALNAGITA